MTDDEILNRLEQAMVKARYCDECRFFTYPDDQEPRCTKGHKPRFYKPKRYFSSDWGYKRRCEDFMLDDKQV